MSAHRKFHLSRFRCRKAVAPAGWCLLLFVATGCRPTLVLATEAPSPATAPASDAGLTQVMVAELQRQGLAGSVWAWIDAQGQTHTGAAGTRDAATGAAMTPQTRVNIGSVTKTLIAVGMLRLASEGRIDLDAPVETYLDGLHFDNPWRARQPVTLRHLLDHTAGLEDARLWQVFTLQANPDSPLSETFSRDPSVLQVRTLPGERFSYSNLGYTLAALALESVAGERYETWLQRELLQPLGMRDSTFAFIRQDRPEGANLAWGHLDNLEPYPSSANWLRPAGQFTTTAADMARFASFLLGDGIVDGRRLVDTRLLREMGQTRSTAAARAGLPAGYALGLARSERQGAVGLCHSGSVVGYHAMLCLYPERRQAFFIAQNSDAETAQYGRFDALLIQAMRLPALAAKTPRPPPPDLQRWPGHYVIDPSRFPAFRYSDLLTGTLRVEATATGSLRLIPLQGAERGLVPVGGGRLFSADDRNTPSYVLLVDEAGIPLISDGLKTYRQQPAWAFWALWANLGVGLIGLVWFLLSWPLRLARRIVPRPGAGTLAVLLLALPGPLFALQPFMALGDRSPAGFALYFATAALAPLMLWQLWRSLRHRPRSGWTRTDAVAAIAVLQWCAVLMAWRMLPFALWI